MRVGILGGGQLAQMLTQAAISLGLETAIYERVPDTPAARLTRHETLGEWGDTAALLRFASSCDVLTLENEFVDATPLFAVQDAGCSVYPSAGTLATIQDKLLQKQRLAAAGLPVPAFEAVSAPGDIAALPGVLKARYGGYDGYGNATLHSPADIEAAWHKLARSRLGVMFEAYVPFVRELAVMVLRGRDGEIRSYPVVETIQQNHICHVVRAPAQGAAVQRARDIAEQAVIAVDGVGIFGVELFELANGEILLNEIAPRPHNSGHYTIEGCVTSQFENHLRAVLGLPLGSVEMRAPAAVMVNLLGKHQRTVRLDGVRAALALDGVHVHLYGKREVRPGRKMGHITVVGEAQDAAEAVARQAADLVEL